VKLDDVNTKIEQQKLGSLKSLLGNKLFGSGMISLLIKVSGAGLSYLMFVAFAHLLNAEDYGLFAFTFNLAVVVSAFAGFGYSTAIMRYLPKYLAQGRPEYANGAIKMGTQLTLLGIVLALLIGFVADHFWMVASNRNYFVVAVLASTFCIGDFAAGVLRAQNSVVASMLPRDVLWRILAPLCALIVVWSGYMLNSNLAIYICASILLALLIFQIAVVHSNMKKNVTQLPAVSDWAGTRKSLLPLWGAGIIFAMIQQMDVVVVGLLANAGETGAYFAAQKTAALLSLVLIAGGLVTAPIMSALYEKKQTQELQKLCRQMVIAIAAVTLLGFLFLVLSGNTLLSIFNPSFTSAYYILLILAFGAMIDAVSGPTAYLMQMTSLETVYARMLAVIYVLVFVLQFIFIPKYGVIAAALANASGVIVWNCVSIYFLRKKIGVDPSLFGIFFPTKVRT
jgi:O-antigen/teichoic acid export membrane protein